MATKGQVQDLKMATEHRHLCMQMHKVYTFVPAPAELGLEKVHKVDRKSILF